MTRLLAVIGLPVYSEVAKRVEQCFDRSANTTTIEESYTTFPKHVWTRVQLLPYMDISMSLFNIYLLGHRCVQTHDANLLYKVAMTNNISSPLPSLVSFSFHPLIPPFSFSHLPSLRSSLPSFALFPSPSSPFRALILPSPLHLYTHSL